MIRFNKETFKDYFHFTKSERNGLFVLIVLIFTVLVIRYTLPYILKPTHQENYQARATLDSFLKNIKPIQKESAYSRLDQFIINRYDSLKLFPFDPNTANTQELEQLGLTEKQIKTLVNYREKGGRFFENEDFRKLYGIRQMQYEILEPYLNISKSIDKKQFEGKKETKTHDKLTPTNFNPNTVDETTLKSFGLSDKQVQSIQNYRSKGGKFKTKADFSKIYTLSPDDFQQLEPFIEIENAKEIKENLMVDINKADTALLNQLPGIGSKLAERIVTYRLALGGYNSVNQLSEIYGLKPETFEAIKNQCYVSNHELIKLRVNFSEVADLKKHPYLKYELARQIIDYRSAHGPYRNLTDLQKVLPADVYNKVSPYMRID